MGSLPTEALMEEINPRYLFSLLIEPAELTASRISSIPSQNLAIHITLMPAFAKELLLT